MAQLVTITELVKQWSQLLTERSAENDRHIAGKMVGTLASNDALWSEWYASGKEPNVTRVFDDVADLELPDGHGVKGKADRIARWEQVRYHVSELENKYL